jgi:cell fate regulator YaaT (PSP1 superfamily)
MRDLAIKSRVLGDGVYYLPIELWPKTKEPVIVHKHDWTVIGSIPRTSRSGKKRIRQA